ncbi:ester cyclase [Oscillatoria sp. FACHB-1406]|uniref:ester cyclase n=1 Tax=Oscillatoria sp. FACHB-1406 TaxID=2692846 RepID=UPI00168732A3|nr:ester cyclase [Oscillatoria sp. FACHB-1406]MBD2576114.1 ester cyclase [Oscillatoria sp. FACHB-1406]
MKSPKAVIKDWLAAYNARDADALIELYHDDAVNQQVAFGAPICGRDALLESFVAFFRAFPDNSTHPIHILEDGEWAVVEWQGSGTFLGELGGNVPNGKSFTLQGCGFFHIVEGKIKFQRGYIDKHTWFAQLELPVV